MDKIASYIILLPILVACGNANEKLSEKKLTVKIEKINSESNDSRSLKAIPTKKKNRINSCISR